MVVLVWVLTVAPEHPALQYAAALQERVCERLPVPHVVLHAPHGPQALQVPATAAQGRYI